MNTVQSVYFFNFSSVPIQSCEVGYIFIMFVDFVNFIKNNVCIMQW